MNREEKIDTIAMDLAGRVAFAWNCMSKRIKNIWRNRKIKAYPDSVLITFEMIKKYPEYFVLGPTLSHCKWCKKSIEEEHMRECIVSHVISVREENEMLKNERKVNETNNRLQS